MDNESRQTPPSSSTETVATPISPAALATTDWMRLITLSRIARLVFRRQLYPKGDPFGPQVCDFYARNRHRLSRYGIHRLFLRVQLHDSQRNYCLTESAGHLTEKYLRIPHYNMYNKVSSRQLRLGSDSSEVTAQLVAYVDPISKDYYSIVQAYLESVLHDLIFASRELTTLGVEIGSSRTQSLYQRYSSDIILPGTYAIKLVEVLPGAIGARIGFFFVYDRGSMYAEYVNAYTNRMRYRQKILGGDRLSFDDKLVDSRKLQQLTSGKKIKLSNADRFLIDFRERYAGILGFDRASEQGAAWMWPIRYDGELIASILFSFDVAATPLSVSAQHLVERTCVKVSSASRYVPATGEKDDCRSSVQEPRHQSR